MASVQIFEYEHLNDFQFAELPKGNMLELAMNPYSGKVFMHVGKQSGAASVALDVMREIVAACDVLQETGSLDPLHDYETLCMCGVLDKVLSDAARAKYRAIEGGKSNKSQVSALVDMEKAV